MKPRVFHVAVGGIIPFSLFFLFSRFLSVRLRVYLVTVQVSHAPIPEEVAPYIPCIKQSVVSQKERQLFIPSPAAVQKAVYYRKKDGRAEQKIPCACPSDDDRLVLSVHERHAWRGASKTLGPFPRLLGIVITGEHS